MADPDRNQFVLLGGEDGWLGSENFADQVALWREGRAISMPLTDVRVSTDFPTQMMLSPPDRAP
jgi:penicillin amidase